MLGEAPVLCHLVLVDAVLAASRGQAAVAREQPVRLAGEGFGFGFGLGVRVRVRG